MRFYKSNREHCFKNGLLRQVFLMLSRLQIQQMDDIHQEYKWHKEFFGVEHLQVALALTTFRMHLAPIDWSDRTGYAAMETAHQMLASTHLIARDMEFKKSYLRIKIIYNSAWYYSSDKGALIHTTGSYDPKECLGITSIN